MIEVTLPDGTRKKYEAGVTGLEIAKSIGPRLAKDAIAIKVDGELIDLFKPLHANCKVELVTFSSSEGKDVFRHSTAHVFAYAVQELYPNAKNTIGPSVEEGFYYDFDDLDITGADLPKIEEKMKEIVKRDERCSRIDLTLDEVKRLFRHNHYKVEMASEFSVAGGKLSAYKIGEKFIDLCRGPHVPSAGYIKAFKLFKVAKAYWRGDPKNKQLTRIYGISFPTEKELNDYLFQRQEAEKRDHRKLGQELDLFMTHEVSPGCAFFLPDGTIIYNELLSFLRAEYFARSYHEVITPVLFDKQLWETSGHWQHYKENMFLTTVEGREFSLKPMNCPSHALIYKSQTRSYRELPLRLADFGVLHRNELSGVISGLTRVRKFQQDDSHIYCMAEQVEAEIVALFAFIKRVYAEVFNFEYRMELSTRPEKFLGEVAMWDKAESLLQSLLEKNKIPYKINPGDGAFYGPKIDLHVKDAIGRSWQLATIQLDFNQAERFDLSYEGADGRKHRPVVIHRAILGSLDRFIGVLIEHFAGKFPLWLSPVQAILLPVADRHIPYAEKVASLLRSAGLRVTIDTRTESVPKKVRDAQIRKYPLMLTVGDKEEAAETVAVRTLDGKVKFDVPAAAFTAQLREDVQRRVLQPTI
ncbi:threonine--tRNA ligase [Candidatus Woesearchaeota archaeon]|nr:threonine--tRNA ligase [Candidatus Woesearchaeota archaeon]